MTVVIENLKMINFKLRTCRFVDQTYEKAIVFLVFLDERYLLSFLENYIDHAPGEISNIWIFEPNNDFLELFSDIKINSFGARVDVNGKKERFKGYHVRNFTFAFAFCLRRSILIVVVVGIVYIV